METPPDFFYNPQAYALGIIKAQAIVCQCCGLARAFCYQGSFYSTRSRAEWQPLCPWCIADGRAADTFDGSFVSDFEGINPDPRQPSQPISAASLAQVSGRTPGYLSWQGDLWLTHCGEASVFKGYAGYAELLPVWEEISADIAAGGWAEQDVRQYLRKDGDLTGYLFQCPRCGQHRLHIDAS